MKIELGKFKSGAIDYNVIAERHSNGIVEIVVSRKGSIWYRISVEHLKMYTEIYNCAEFQKLLLMI